MKQGVRVLAMSMLIALIVIASATAATLTWRVVKSGSSTGDFAIKAISATVNHPRGLGVRFIGRVDSGSGIVSCSKGYGVASAIGLS